MAKTDTTIEPDQEEDIQRTSEDQDSANAPASGYSAPRHFLYFGDNPGGVRIDRILVGGQSQVEKNIDIQPGQKMEIGGGGLDIYDKVLLAVEGSPGVTARVKALVVDRAKGTYINFQIPDLSKILGDKGKLSLQLISGSKDPDASGILYYTLNYQKKTEEDKSKEAEKGGDREKGKAGGSGSTAGASGMGPTGMVMSAMGDAIGGVVKPFAPGSFKRQESRKKIQELLKSGDKKALKKALEKAIDEGDEEGLEKLLKDAQNPEDKKTLREALSKAKIVAAAKRGEGVLQDGVLVSAKGAKEKGVADGGGSNDEGASQESGGVKEAPVAAMDMNLRQSMELVGEHLEKNPELIVDRSTRESVLQALSSGDLQSLNAKGHAALQQVLQAKVTGRQGGTVQLRAAMENVGKVSSQVSVSGKISGETTARTETAVSGSVGVSGQATASAEQRTEVSGQAEASVSGSSTASAQASATVEAQQNTQANTEPATSSAISGSGTITASQAASVSAGGLSLRQSAEIVGEYLQKNPELIRDAKARSNVFEALGSGDLGKLNPQGQAALQEVVKASVPVERSGNVRLAAAMQNISKATSTVSEQEPQPQSSAVLTEQKSINVEAEQGMPAAPASAQDISIETKGEEKQPVESQQPQATKGEQEVEAESGQPEQLQPQQSSAAEKHPAEEAGPRLEEKQPEAKPQTPQEKEADRLAQAKEKAPVPPQYAAMINALAEKDKNRQVAGIDGAVPKSNTGKKKDVNVLQAEKSTPPSPVAQEKPDDGKRDGEKAGLSAASQLPLKPAEGPSEPAIPPPLNPEELEQAQTEENPEEAEGDAVDSEVGDHLRQFSAQNGQQVSSSNQRIRDGRGSADIENKKRKEELEKITKGVNKIINGLLKKPIAWVWGSVLITFGLSVFVGAVAGDLLWLFKKTLIKTALKMMPHGGLQTDPKGETIYVFTEEEVAEQVKFSWAVKGNIIAMNLAVIAVGFLIFIFIISVLWGICNSWVTYPIRQVSGLQEVCQAIDKSGIGTTLSSMRSSGSFTGSYNVPGTLTGTAQWTQQINTYAQKYNLDACVLRVVVQKESSGNSSSIGHDGHSSASDSFNPNNPPGHNLNWQYSHGIGLTQWTVFPYVSGGWVDSQTPSRRIFNSWYTVKDLLNPDTSLDLTAHDFSNKIASNLSKPPRQLDSSDDAFRNALRLSFAQYNGGGSYSSKAIEYANASMALFDLCKKQ